MKKIKVLIVGGCFTQQSDIVWSNLYHQIIKQKLAKENNIDVEIIIVRYERLSKCFEKITTVCQQHEPDYFLFHLRAEPILRVSKLYYKYRDSNGRMNRSLNLLPLNINKPESHRHFINRDTISSNVLILKKENVTHYILREANYILGLLVGNLSNALNSYMGLIKEINEFCINKGIKLMIIGPVSRPHTLMEDFISIKLNNRFESCLQFSNVSFVKCLGVYTDDSQKLFSEGGILVNETGHKRIADLIYTEMKNSFIPFVRNKFLPTAQ
ncbi:MAG: hypothetical protein A2068_05845 [Ignavibacteria bacterium GWB2_35_6b]|nr:MAG: hypothetical protein A2068_05845 [Ignavibacteria bacterium GWB2_35_6b]